MQCPRCKLLSPPGSLICECGYELTLPADMQRAEMRERPITGRQQRLRNASLVMLLMNVLPWAWYGYEYKTSAAGNPWFNLLIYVVAAISAILTTITVVLFLLSLKRD